MTEDTLPEMQPRLPVKDSGETMARRATIADLSACVDRKRAFIDQMESDHIDTQDRLFELRIADEKIDGPKPDGTKVLLKYNGEYREYVWVEGDLIMERRKNYRECTLSRAEMATKKKANGSS